MNGHPVPPPAPRLRSLPSSCARTTGLTIYGCGPDEAAQFQDLAPRWGVVPTIVEAPASEANTELAVGNRCISVTHKNRIDEADLRALSRAGVRYVSTRSVGVDHIDVPFAASVGITVGNVAYSPDSVADYTLMLILMAVRHAKSVLRRTDVHDYTADGLRGRELRELTVGVVGTGRIGSAVVDRLRGFGCRTITHDVRPTTPGGYVRLDDLLQHSDVVSLHVPLSAETRHLLDRRRIERLKPGAFVVNTGRGALLDTEALLRALESGALGGAALDVLEGEEGVFYADCRNRALDNSVLARLQELPNVVITPHIAYCTGRALRDTVENTLINCIEFEKGRTTWTG